jgi:hypothetical protein
MATGTFGTVRGADITPQDVDIFIHYTANRNTTGGNVTKVSNPAEYLIPIDDPSKADSNITQFSLFGGMYTLKLPVTEFGAKGFYTIMIKPVEIRTRIVDCGVLSAYPDIKGLVFDLAEINGRFVSRFDNGGLSGYRVEYLDNENITDAKVHNLFRIITSNNKAEPVNQNLTNSSQKAIRYRFNDNSTLVFCTVTPSSSSNVKPNVLPSIGVPNQEVIITNTYFNPIMIEVEMVEHDIETLAYGIFGNQTKSLEDGIYTIYNFSNEIYKQYNLYEIKDQFTGKPLFEVKEERDGIDFNKEFNNVANI